MRKDTTFSERKLTREEFSKKYWLDGEMPYQYHTGSIEDGRDEREQFVFNNIRALYELHKNYDLEQIAKVKADLLEVKRIVIKQKKRNFMTILLAMIILISLKSITE